MKKLIVNKELLNDYTTLNIVFENIDDYSIPVKDILDLYCEAELTNKKDNTYTTSDGFIKISARASQIIEESVLRNNSVGAKWDTRLKERLQMCDGAGDVVHFSLHSDKSRKVDIVVPYDPLVDVFNNSEMEWSNCSSLEIDSEGNMTILFGERSKQPRRKDNDYAKIVEGWKDAFGDNEPTILKVKADLLEMFGDKEKNFKLDFEILDKFCKRKFAELVFVGCKDVNFEMIFPVEGDCEIFMSKMIDGKIYVGLDGLGIDFICDSVFEYEYYCKQKEKK